MRKKSWQPKKMKNLFFLWQMVQQSYQEETTNSKNPLWDWNPPWGERISAENLMAIGKSFNLQKQKMTKESMRFFLAHAEARKEFHLSSSYWTEKFKLRAEWRIIIPYLTRFYIIERNSSERKFSMRWEDWRKAKTSEAETNSIILTLQGKDGMLYIITTLRENSFRWKDLKKALHLIFFEGESKYSLSRLAAQRICEAEFIK